MIPCTSATFSIRINLEMCSCCGKHFHSSSLKDYRRSKEVPWMWLCWTCYGKLDGFIAAIFDGGVEFLSSMRKHKVCRLYQISKGTLESAEIYYDPPGPA